MHLRAPELGPLLLRERVEFSSFYWCAFVELSQLQELMVLQISSLTFIQTRQEVSHPHILYNEILVV